MEEKMEKTMENIKLKEEQRKTLMLCTILTVCVFILLMLSIALFNSMQSSLASAPQYIELPDLQGMSLATAKAELDKAGIGYRIVPSDSRVANRVEKYEFDGSRTDDGKILVNAEARIKIFSNEVSADKVVYLTFDDGPKVNYTYSMDVYHTTGQLLDVLDKYKIKATFFIVGYQMIKSDRSEYVSDMLDRGHLLACHTSTHELNEIYSSSSKFVADIQRFENELKEIIGEERYNYLGKYIRFPGGSSTNGRLDKEEAKEYISDVRNMGYKVYDWTALTGDAEGNSTASEFIEYMDQGLAKANESGEPLIVLMHDLEATRIALPEIIDHLIEAGYYFDTIDSCPEYTFAEK